jgi:EmrB/QacA subfamily drug resistance transporter
MTKQQRLVLIICILASFVAFLDGSVVNVALPAISRDFGGGLALQQWVVDAYLISLGALMLIAGSLSDLFGRRKILKLGLVGFGVASLLCAIAPSGLFLVLSRGLQGVAGALLVPSSLAIIISTFSGAAQGKAIGSWTAWTGIAFVIGPLLGGFLVDSYSWRLIFLINILPIALTLLLLRSAKTTTEKAHAEVDYSGAVLGAVGLGGIVFALIEQARYGWSSPVIWAPMAVGIVASLAFVGYERRTKQPMLPLSLFKVRNFSVGNVATAAIYGGLSIATFITVVFLQQTAGYSAIQAGLALLPITLIMFLSPRFGQLATKYGPRLFMASGPLVASAGFLLLLGITSRAPYWSEVFPGIAIFGLGLSMTVAPLTSAILGSIDHRQAGIGSAVNNAVSRVAGLVAIATVGVVTGSVLDVRGFHRGVIVMATLLALGGVISWVGISNNRNNKVPIN